MQDKFIGFIIILAALIAVLLISALKKRAEWMLTFLFRAVTGTVIIYFVNMAIASTDMGIEIGINPMTVLTSGILGFPGILLLYAINLINLL